MPPLQRFGQRPADRPAGVVDQDVHPAKVPFDLCGQFVDRVEVGQVAGVCPSVAAGGGDPIDHGVQQFLAPRDMRHVVAKIAAEGNESILFTERGVSFGIVP